MSRIAVVVLVSALLAGCRTAPPAIDTTKTDILAVDVMQTQTEIAAAAKDVSASIEDIKEITDAAKTTGEIPKESVPALILHVDELAAQNSAMESAIEKQAWQIPAFDKSRIYDNSASAKVIAEKQALYDKEKAKASILFKWAIIASFVAILLAFIMFISRK